MVQLIPLVCLVVVLASYRLAEPRCRWLARWWKWERETDARVNAMKNRIGLAFLPVVENALAELGAAMKFTSAAMVEFGDSITDMAQAGVELRLDIIESTWER